MAKSVNAAFDEYMRESVNLDPEVVTHARSSRDNLLANIKEFNDDSQFFTLYENFNVHFGSFARKTKCRSLDDIDLMIGIGADGATYNTWDTWDDQHIMASRSNPAQIRCTNSDGTLNSTEVANLFKKKLENVREYSRSEIRRNGEAIVLNLKSKEWSFDIVPCFHTTPESNGREYYLIPNGHGGWEKTDPIKDREKVTSVNQSRNGYLLELIRLFKKWNKVKNAKTIPSYLLETLLVNYAETQTELSQWIDIRFRDALPYIANHITLPVYDMKDIQGDINTVSLSDALTLQLKAQTDYKKAVDAGKKESDGDQEGAIKKWGEIFGSEFPKYE